MSGWLKKRTLSIDLKQYLSVSTQLSIANGLLLQRKRIIVPPPLRGTLLGKLHSGHQGITKCRERARQLIWWPGLSKQLDELIQNCEKCLKAQRQRPQPLNSTPLSQSPWQKVVTDLFEWKRSTYLLIIDYFS